MTYLEASAYSLARYKAGEWTLEEAINFASSKLEEEVGLEIDEIDQADLFFDRLNEDAFYPY